MSSVPFITGMNFAYLAPASYWESEQALHAIQEMAHAGIRYVSLNITMMQEAFHSTRIYADYYYTPSDRSIARICKAIHDAGMSIIMKPQIECHDSSWRGMIGFPEDNEQIQGIVTNRWPIWFTSYTQAICHYGALAEECGCELFTVAQELAKAELQADHWLDVITEVRKNFNGLCVVNAMAEGATLEHPQFLRWVQELDAVGFSNYHEISTGPATVENIQRVVEQSLPRWRKAAHTLQKPIYWAETGCRSVVDGHRKPWEYRHQADADQATQASWIEGFLRAWINEDWWCGYQLWKWDEQQHRPQYQQPGGDAGFTIRGKKAETILAGLNQELFSTGSANSTKQIPC